jgi:hypothetical protein
MVSLGGVGCSRYGGSLGRPRTDECDAEPGEIAHCPAIVALKGDVPGEGHATVHQP